MDCGFVDWSTITPLGTYDTATGSLCVEPQTGDIQTYCQQEQNAVASVVNDMMPAASRYFCKYIGSNGTDHAAVLIVLHIARPIS